MSTAPGTVAPWPLLRLIVGPAAVAMVVLILLQEAFGAATTWLVIGIARDIVAADLHWTDFLAIGASQTLSYAAGAIAWVYAERAGFGAYGRYVLAFARENRRRPELLGDAVAREQAEPFLTGETFQVIFALIYDLQFHLRLFFNVLLNALVLGLAIDGDLPWAYALAFLLLMGLQWWLKKPLTAANLKNQAATNRMTARTYNAWDSVFAGNAYNFRLWHRDFRGRLSAALSAQVRAIVLREGWSAFSGLIVLAIVLTTTASVALADVSDAALLVALAATLPRQIEMTHDMHQLTAGVSDLIAVWARLGGVCAAWRPEGASSPGSRIDFSCLILSSEDGELPLESLAEALSATRSASTGRLALRGGNGAGKSSLLVMLKGALGASAYYWPSHDRLNFAFNTESTVESTQDGDEDEEDEAQAAARESQQLQAGYSSGQRQLAVLRELVEKTACTYYLLDEWDANLDAAHRCEAEELIAELSRRARVIEISHRDVLSPI